MSKLNSLPENTFQLSPIYSSATDELYAGYPNNYIRLYSKDEVDFLLTSNIKAGDNISLLSNNIGYIVSGTSTTQVRNNQQLDERYLRTETDPTVPSHVKGITTTDINNWNTKLSGITAGTNVSLDWTQPQNPVINVTVPESGLTSITLTGDITGTGGSSITTTISNSSVTLPKLQNISRGTVLGLAGGGTNTWTLLTPSHGTYVGEWKPNLHAAVNFLVSYENKLYRVMNYNDPVPPPTSPSQYQLIHSNFRRFTYGVTYYPGMLVVMGVATPNYYTTSANITNIAPTDTPVNTPSSPQELTVGDGLVVTPGGVLRTTGSEAITDLIQAGNNISIAGNGTPSSPYIITAIGGDGGSGGSSTLSGLTDVNVTGATNGQVLTYNSGTWLPTTISGGGSFQLRSGSNSYLSGNVSLIAGTGVSLSQSGQNITITATGTAASVFTRTVNGLVPAPGGSGTTRYLREDGTWQAISGGSGGSSVDLVTAGSATVGAIRYAGTSKTSGQMYGGVANPSNSTRLNYDGTLHAYDFVGYGVSDIRKKENLVKIGGALDKIDKLNGYRFTWKDDENHIGLDYGLIAQEVEAILPEIVIERNGTKAIKTGNQIIALLLEGIKELNNKIENMRNGIS